MMVIGAHGLDSGTSNFKYATWVAPNLGKLSDLKE